MDDSSATCSKCNFCCTIDFSSYYHPIKRSILGPTVSNQRGQHHNFTTTRKTTNRKPISIRRIRCHQYEQEKRRISSKKPHFHFLFRISCLEALQSRRSPSRTARARPSVPFHGGGAASRRTVEPRRTRVAVVLPDPASLATPRRNNTISQPRE
jgi:hypothetical protein